MKGNLRPKLHREKQAPPARLVNRLEEGRKCGHDDLQRLVEDIELGCWPKLPEVWLVIGFTDVGQRKVEVVVAQNPEDLVALRRA